MKRFIPFLLILLVFVSGSYAYTGSGTSVDPFIIMDCNGLQTIESYTRAAGDPDAPNQYWDLGNDLNCVDACPAGCNPFDPLGEAVGDIGFLGHLDGKGFTVSTVTINESSELAALFVNLYTTATVSNIGLINFSVTNTVNGTAVVAAHCFNDVIVDNVFVQGGIVNQTGGTLYTGGFFGSVRNSCMIKDSYVVDTTVTAVAGVARIGGFVGWTTNDANVFNSYSNAAVTSVNAGAGAFIGEDSSSIACPNSFYDTDTAIEVGNACGTGKTTANMFKQATFTNWNFTNVWNIVEDVNYPTLQAFVPGFVGVIDLNIATINGFDFKTNPIFVFGLDGNITIDFNVFSQDNNRLSIDLNNSISEAQGSGAVIVKDLNLTATYCPDQDFSTVSKCSFLWDYSGITDGNYVIIGLLTDTPAGLTDFNGSDGNFMIQSDVNIIVQIPINEETGAIIDLTISSFIVRINAGGILSIFDNQKDVNGFSVPIGSDLILVEIDTNTPALFNSRVYAFTFPTAQATENLQPYLPPVDASILTTVKTAQFENLIPIPNVRLKVFKDLAGGRTLIHDTVTDGKGETSIPFIVADIYEIEVIVDGVIIFTEAYIATATTNEHFIFISSTGEVVPPNPLTIPNVQFTPAQKHFNTVDINLGVIVSTELSNIASIEFFITNNDFNVFDGGIDSSAPADGNTYLVRMINLQDVSDNNFPFVSTVIVILVDGNRFIFSASYTIKPNPDNPLNILIYDMRTSFGCDIDNLNSTCSGLMFVAFFIILFVVAGFAIGTRGATGGVGLALIGLILTMFFVFIMWIPLWLGIVMVFAAIGVILTRTRFIGDQ